MKKNKVTIKDIARESGVSVATVSYVLNNRADQKISEETRKKVLQIVNLLGYTSSPAARSLATGKTGHIAVYPSLPAFPLKQAEQFAFLNELSFALETAGYQMLYLNRTHTIRLDNADAILCLGTTTDFFRCIADNNFVPLIFTDGIVHDPWLFYQVNDDFQYISSWAAQQFQTENYLCVCCDLENQLLKEEINQAFPDVCFIDSFQKASVVAHQTKPILALGTFLSDYFVQHQVSVLSYPLPIRSKISHLIECIHLSIGRAVVETHDIRVRPEP